MNAEAIVRLRKLAGYLGALLGLVVAFAIYDGLASQFGQDPNLFRAVPGETLLMNGPMPEKAESTDDLVLSGEQAGLRLRFESVYSGFWLGGRMWKGDLAIDETAEAGLRQFSIVSKDGAAGKGPAFTVKIFPNEKSLRLDSPSLITRLTGWRPGMLAAAVFPALVAVFALAYLLSRSLEKLMAQAGRAEIFMLKKSPEGHQISFGLGGRQGLAVGDVVQLFDESGLRVGAARVVSVTESDSVAVAPRESDVHLGYVVSLGEDRQTV